MVYSQPQWWQWRVSTAYFLARFLPRSSLLTRAQWPRVHDENLPESKIRKFSANVYPRLTCPVVPLVGSFLAHALRHAPRKDCLPLAAWPKNFSCAQRPLMAPSVEFGCILPSGQSVKSLTVDGTCQGQCRPL